MVEFPDILRGNIPGLDVFFDETINIRQHKVLDFKTFSIFILLKFIHLLIFPKPLVSRLFVYCCVNNFLSLTLLMNLIKFKHMNILVLILVATR